MKGYIANKFGDAKTIEWNLFVRKVPDAFKQYQVGKSPLDREKDTLLSFQVCRWESNGDVIALPIPKEIEKEVESIVAMLEDVKLHGDLDLSLLRYNITTSDLRLWKDFNTLSDLRWFYHELPECDVNFSHLNRFERDNLHQKSLVKLEEIKSYC